MPFAAHLFITLCSYAVSFSILCFIINILHSLSVDFLLQKGITFLDLSKAVFALTTAYSFLELNDTTKRKGLVSAGIAKLFYVDRIVLSYVPRNLIMLDPVS